jgi:NmrA-like family
VEVDRLILTEHGLSHLHYAEQEAAPNVVRVLRRLAWSGVSLLLRLQTHALAPPPPHRAQRNARHRCRAAADFREKAAADFREKAAADINVVVFGSTGYIGKKVTNEMVKRGFNVVAVSRERSGIGGGQTAADVQSMFEGATCRFADVTDMGSLESKVFECPVDVVISCLASRTGGIKDSWDIDYQVLPHHPCFKNHPIGVPLYVQAVPPRSYPECHSALWWSVCSLRTYSRHPSASARKSSQRTLQATKNCVDAGRAAGATHFILLSAICVQKPLLEFQKAKLKLEAELQQAGDMTHSIVRPTAFFKSIAGQVNGSCPC